MRGPGRHEASGHTGNGWEMVIKGCLAYDWDLNIAGRSIHLAIEDRFGRSARRLTDRFRPYLAAPDPNAVRISVAGYRKGKTFPWSGDRVQSFATCIGNTLARLPHIHGIEKGAAQALSVLERIDPRHPAMSRLKDLDDNRLLFAMTAGTVFMFSPQRRAAAAFVPKALRGDPVPAGAMNAVMFVLSRLLTQHQGLLLHGSAVERDGSTVLFIGRSGSGKTTAARLCRPDTCFADDGVAVVRENGCFRVFHSPFRQIDDPNGAGSGRCGTIGKVFLLEKDTVEGVSDVSRATMMHFILQHAIHFFKYLDDRAVRNGFETLRQLVETVPVYRLHFTPHSNVWQMISDIDNHRRTHVRSET